MIVAVRVRVRVSSLEWREVSDDERRNVTSQLCEEKFTVSISILRTAA
jgi:predicted Fe-S protein YdhL (DUF1289 family)